MSDPQTLALVERLQPAIGMLRMALSLDGKTIPISPSFAAELIELLREAATEIARLTQERDTLRQQLAERPCD